MQKERQGKRTAMTLTTTLGCRVTLTLVLLTVLQVLPVQCEDNSSLPEGSADQSVQSSEAPSENRQATRNPIYSACTTDGNCDAGITCVDYGALYPPKTTKVCDCEKPTTLDPKDGCYCMAGTSKVRRWMYLKGGLSNPPDKGDMVFPKANAKAEGCYLNTGEVCDLTHDANAAAETHTICTHQNYCKKLTDKFGFCRFGATAASFAASALLVASTSALLLLQPTN